MIGKRFKMNENKIQELLKMLSNKYYFECREDGNYYPENSLVLALKELEV